MLSIQVMQTTSELSDHVRKSQSTISLKYLDSTVKPVAKINKKSAIARRK